MLLALLAGERVKQFILVEFNILLRISIENDTFLLLLLLDRLCWIKLPGCVHTCKSLSNMDQK